MESLDIDKSLMSGMSHAQWTVHDSKYKNYVPFSTRIQDLCRMRTHLNCPTFETSFQEAGLV